MHSWQDQRRKRLSVTRLEQAGVKKAFGTAEGLACGGGLLLSGRRGPSTRGRTPAAGEERA